MSLLPYAVAVIMRVPRIFKDFTLEEIGFSELKLDWETCLRDGIKSIINLLYLSRFSWET